MENQVDDSVKAQRSKMLIDLADSIAKDFMKQFIDRNMPVLIETHKKENIFEGYTTNYLKVLIKSDINIKNQIVDVCIKNVRNEYLWSE